MLLSMTGFGAARYEENNLSAAVELRAINSRYFKISTRANESQAALESRVEASIRQHVKRGTVQVNVRIDRLKSADQYQLSEDVLEYLANPTTKDWEAFAGRYVRRLERRFAQNRQAFDELADIAKSRDLYLGCNCPTA